jgi:hypothetical protein
MGLGWTWSDTRVHVQCGVSTSMRAAWYTVGMHHVCGVHGVLTAGILEYSAVEELGMHEVDIY